jgi:hypothetical protein
MLWFKVFSGLVSFIAEPFSTDNECFAHFGNLLSIEKINNFAFAMVK